MKLMKLINKLKSKIMFFVLTCYGTAYAAMPTPQPPSQGTGGGYFNTIRGYIYDGAVVIGLLIAAAALLAVAKNVIVEFNNISEGKGTWTKFGTFIVIGVVLVVACIWLATEAVETLSSI
ncbi:TIGR03745 family integrating conjugative element membrane protein [Gilliamella apicola]|uniref:TIGR03745 family integrating conjugative element membrane protein n=2 Tax=Gilliamella apicola TaxID=1196095 RepID=UPI002FEE2420